MRFPAKTTSSCISVAIPVDLVILHWYACVADGWSLRQAGGGSVYGHAIAKFSRMGRLLHFFYPWCSAGAFRARELRYNYYCEYPFLHIIGMPYFVACDELTLTFLPCLVVRNAVYM